MVLFGHVHNYERTCAVYRKECKQMPVTDGDGNGVDTYDNSNYAAPVHVTIGMAGFTLKRFLPVVSMKIKFCILMDKIPFYLCICFTHS